MPTAPRIDAWTVIDTIAAFLLLSALTPFDRAGTPAHRWLEEHGAESWLILTASHLLHLGQIGLHYRLGESCPLTVWLVTIPVWLVMVAVRPAAALGWGLPPLRRVLVAGR